MGTNGVQLLKKTQNCNFSQPVLESILETFGYLFGTHFSGFFEGAVFAPLGELWASWVSKKPPKRSRKGGKSTPGGTLGNTLKAWQALYGRHMRRSRAGSRNHLFPDCVPRLSPRASRGVFFQLLCDLGRL